MPDTPNDTPEVLPDALRDRLNGRLNGDAIVAWSEFDLSETNAYAQRFVVLTDQRLIVLGDAGTPPEIIPIAQIDEAKVIEGLGIDRWTILSGGRLAAEVRYSRRFRRDVSRLHRKLERRLPGKQNADRPPDWLENVERASEKSDHCPKCGQLIPAYAEGVCPRCLQQKKILWRLFDIAKPYRKKIFGALAVTLLMAVVTTLPPWITRHLIDDGIESLNTRRTLYWCTLMAVAILAAEGLNGIRMYVLATVGTSVTRDLRHLVYAHLHDLSLRFFAKRRTGSLITRVTNDTDRLWDFIAFGAVDFIRNVFIVLAIAVVMLSMNWKLALIALLPLPVLAVVTYIRSRTLQAMWSRLWTYWSRMGAVVGDAIPGVRVVKAFANEHREIRRFNARSEEYTNKEQEIHRAWTTLVPLVGATMRLGGVLVWFVGGAMVIRHGNKGEYTVGMLVAFTQFLWQFYGPIMELVNSNRMVTRAAASAQRVFEVLDTPPEIFSRAGALTKDRVDGRVEFRQVSFSYEGTEPALREISMLAEPGQMIGLCGPSGAGKSTLVNLICRFYDATDGQILLDGVDVREYDVRWLRRQIGVVLQEPYLFHGTIAENIRYGNPDASEEQVMAAAKAANAHDFVVGFADGYDTMVGERGQSLSGGERQRISIARAILHNPRILILDEATSSVDTETEKQIQQALDRLVEGRTTFAIAHRLSTLQSADRLIVLEKGRIVEEGKHDELLKREEGKYAKLVRTQMEMATVGAFA